MNDFTKLALDWLAEHPNPRTITNDPANWAEQTGEAIFQRTRELLDQLVPPVPDEEFLTRVGRLNSAWQMATEIAIDEYLPGYATPDDQEDWVPLMPDISDLL